MNIIIHVYKSPLSHENKQFFNIMKKFSKNRKREDNKVSSIVTIKCQSNVNHTKLINIDFAKGEMQVVPHNL